MNDQLIKQYVKKDVRSTAVYSNCERYRYSLSRTHLKAKRSLLFILLNPSTATELINDPTVSRCQRRAELLGFEAFTICNLFAFRTKNPNTLKSYPKPVGPENITMIKENIILADQVLCAWGNNGTHLNQAQNILSIIKTFGVRAYHLGLTKNNQPRHLLYIDYKQRPEKWF